MKNIATVLALVLAFCFIVAVQAQEPDHPGQYSLHQVRAGDTLWGISQKYMPEVDPRIGIEWIREVNSMRKDCMIHPGDILNVPTADGPLTEPLGGSYSSPEVAEQAEKELQKLLRKEHPRPATRGSTARTMSVEATAYCECELCTGKAPGHPAYGITASGEMVRPGVVAVDPAVIPLGTQLWVEGYGAAVALDTGGAIKGKMIDVYFPSHRQALEWGRKQVRLVIE